MMTVHVSAGMTDLLGMTNILAVHLGYYLSSFWVVFIGCAESVLKSTGSAFSGFVRDEYTTLAEVDDRIFSTSIDLVYTFVPVSVPPPTDEKKLEFSVPTGGTVQEGTVWDENVPERARKATLETFAKDESASVQVRCVRPSKEFRHLRVLRTARSISVNARSEDAVIFMCTVVTKMMRLTRVIQCRRHFTRWARGSSRRTRA